VPAGDPQANLDDHKGSHGKANKPTLPIQQLLLKQTPP
jgi:hypothetical protein